MVFRVRGFVLGPPKYHHDVYLRVQDIGYPTKAMRTEYLQSGSARWGLGCVWTQ